MTPVERLEAAIAKLEQSKAESTQGDWWFESMPETGESRIGSDADGFAFMGATTVTFYPVPGQLNPSDAELIVTLHRTIVAQLAILREAHFQVSGAPEARGFIGNEFSLVMRLADAILGGDS